MILGDDIAPLVNNHTRAKGIAAICRHIHLYNRRPHPGKDCFTYSFYPTPIQSRNGRLCIRSCLSFTNTILTIGTITSKLPTSHEPRAKSTYDLQGPSP